MLALPSTLTQIDATWDYPLFISAKLTKLNPTALQVYQASVNGPRVLSVSCHILLGLVWHAFCDFTLHMRLRMMDRPAWLACLSSDAEAAVIEWGHDDDFIFSSSKTESPVCSCIGGAAAEHLRTKTKNMRQPNFGGSAIKFSKLR